MEFAKSETTHSPSRINGRFVGEGVGLGFGVGVDVLVGVRVTVALCEAVGVRVGVLVSVYVEVARGGVVAGAVVRVGVAVESTEGTRTNVDMTASRIPIPMITGTKYLRSIRGSAGVLATGKSPVYPNASSNCLRLSA